MLWLSYGYVMVILWYWLEIGTRLGRKTSLQPSPQVRGKGAGEKASEGRYAGNRQE